MRALALALTVVAAQASVSMIGSPAPAFTGTTHTGASLSLADYQGKGLVIWFYPKAGTGG